MEMTAGNSAASGVNAAKTAPGDTPKPCEELDGKNTAQRTALAKDPESKSIQKNFGPGGVTTVVHGSLDGGPAIGAASRLLPSRYSHLAQGLWAGKNKQQRAAMKKSGTSNVCPGNQFKYQKAARPHQSHCESKILETMFSASPAPSGTLLLNINWQSSADPNAKIPCPACKKLLCHAQTHCNLKIELCPKNPKKPPTALKC
jgi:hypothetical protein